MRRDMFQPLEPRTLLAMTATVESVQFTPGEASVVVLYSGESAINVSTVDIFDIGFTSSATHARFADSVSGYQLDNGSARVTYRISALVEDNQRQMFRVGTYNFGIKADAVRDVNQTPNDETAVGSYWIAYNDVEVEFVAATTNNDGWNFAAVYWTRNVQQWVETRTARIHINGPNGLAQTATLTGRSNTPRTELHLAFINPDGTWDYADTGTYTLATGNPTQPNQVPTPVASYYLWYTNPKAEFLSRVMHDNYVEYYVRFSDDQGIDLDSLRWSNVGIQIPRESQNRTIPPLMDLYARPEMQQDGSVIVAFTRGYFESVWNNVSNGDWRWTANGGTLAVRDLAGNATLGGVIHRETMNFNKVHVTASNLLAFPDNGLALAFTMTFTAHGVDIPTFRYATLRVVNGGNTISLSLSLNTLRRMNDNPYGEPVYTATFVPLAPLATPLVTGVTETYFNPGLFFIGLRVNADQFIRSDWLWFSA